MSEEGPSRGDIEAEGTESDAEQAESEWHAWLAGMVLVGGIALILVPDDFVPELLLGIGPLFVALGVLGWIIQWSIKKFG